MSMLNTPDNGAPNGAATTHRGQVAPSASHTTQVAGGEFIAAGADSQQTNIIGKRETTATVTGGNAGANDDAEELVGADHADVHSTLDTLLDQEDINAVIQYLTSKALVGNLDSQAMTRLLNDTEAFGKDILQEIGIFVEKYFPGSGRPSSLEKIAFRASLHARRESVLQGYVPLNPSGISQTHRQEQLSTPPSARPTGSTPSSTGSAGHPHSISPDGQLMRSVPSNALVTLGNGGTVSGSAPALTGLNIPDALSRLDASNGFYQAGLDATSASKTAFQTPSGPSRTPPRHPQT